MGFPASGHSVCNHVQIDTKDVRQSLLQRDAATSDQGYTWCHSAWHNDSLPFWVITRDATTSCRHAVLLRLRSCCKQLQTWGAAAHCIWCFK